jgi:hypothetical protein
MHPIYYTVGDQLSLMIIPDTQAHLNGHTIITRTYRIFKHIAHAGNVQLPESILKVDNSADPNYMGCLVFDIPGKLYSYEADGNIDLTPDEVEELIEHLNHYRDNPDIWPI